MAPFTFWDMQAGDIKMFVYKHTETIGCVKKYPNI